jgi:plasmid stabilization system protein ParE
MGGAMRRPWSIEFVYLLREEMFTVVRILHGKRDIGAILEE